jgi:muramoyltetrapeptide carboxypeptidase
LLEQQELLPRSNPSQWLLGFSDVTSLLWSRQAAGIPGGIHGPMLTSLAGEPAWSQERLRQLLFGEPLAALTGTSWQDGVAEGPLLVGNLTVATHLLGTPHLPDLRGAVLVLEDVGEAPYRLDRMLTHWRLCGALQQLAGIGFGRFSGCDDDEEPIAPDQGWRTVLQERTADLGIPVIADLPVGHEPGNAALIIGQRVRLDASRGELVVLQA